MPRCAPLATLTGLVIDTRLARFGNCVEGDDRGD